MRLRHSADLVLVEAEAAGLTEPARIRKLATWFDAANRTRELLQTKVRADLAVAELLLAWRGEDGGAVTQARGRACARHQVAPGMESCSRRGGTRRRSKPATCPTSSTRGAWGPHPSPTSTAP